MIIIHIDFEALCLLLLVTHAGVIIKVLKVLAGKIKQLKHQFTIWVAFRTKDGRPTRCPYCGGRDIERGKYIEEEPYGIVEYDVLCKSCDRKVATWRYGGWDYD